MTRENVRMAGTLASYTAFRGSGGVTEYHVMISVTDVTVQFQQQLDAVSKAFEQLTKGELEGATAVLKRYFLSDAANQADEVMNSDTSCCAKSITEQAPLDGTKIALWAYLMTGVTTRQTDSGLFEASHSDYRHLWNASAYNLADNSELQTKQLFEAYVAQLKQEGCTLADNCIRTWLFVNDIDLNYSGVVRARNQIFQTHGLTTETHYIASTGIAGRQQNPHVLTQMDNYAVKGISNRQVRYLYAPTHLNQTSDYGVSFERGTAVDYGDRRHVFISGTASIDNQGQIVHSGDVVKQTHRMWENVEALLSEAGCGYDDVGVMVVYLRDVSDYAVVSRLYQERFPDKPYVIVHAPVCRSGWLVEMECIAVKAQHNEAFATL